MGGCQKVWRLQTIIYNSILSILIFYKDPEMNCHLFWFSRYLFTPNCNTGSTRDLRNRSEQNVGCRGRGCCCLARQKKKKFSTDNWIAGLVLTKRNSASHHVTISRWATLHTTIQHKGDPYIQNTTHTLHTNLTLPHHTHTVNSIQTPPKPTAVRTATHHQESCVRKVEKENATLPLNLAQKLFPIRK